MRRGLCILIAASFASCGGPTSSAGPSSIPLPGGTGPGFVVTVDGRASAVAIVGASEVKADAGQFASGATAHAIDFGDGTPASSDAVATHVYEEPGAFTVSLRITGKSGVTTVAKSEVVVQSVKGAWSNAQLNARVGFVEVRRLTITSQTGADVRGLYASSSAQLDRRFTGSLTPGRRLRLVLEDQTVQFDGVIPDGGRTAGSTMPVAVRGGTADGDTLPFSPVPEDLGSPPVASLRITAGGASGHGIVGLPLLFDASGSRGEDLVLGISFGDGAVAYTATAEHALATKGHYTSVVTATDRFGRSSSATVPLLVSSLIDGTGTPEANWVASSPTGNWRLFFSTDDGHNVAGHYFGQNEPPDRGSFVGTITDAYGLHLKLRADDAREVLLDGTIELKTPSEPQNHYPLLLHLTPNTGRDAGVLLTFYMTDPY